MHSQINSRFMCLYKLTSVTYCFYYTHKKYIYSKWAQYMEKVSVSLPLELEFSIV